MQSSLLSRHANHAKIGHTSRDSSSHIKKRVRPLIRNTNSSVSSQNIALKIYFLHTKRNRRRFNKKYIVI